MPRTSAPMPGSRQRSGRRTVRWSRRAALGRLAATGAALALLPTIGASSAHAQAPARQAGCSSGPEPVSWRPAAPAALAADLPDPFNYRPDATDRAAVLREVGQVVQQQAAELGVEACYLEKVTPIVQRIELL